MLREQAINSMISHGFTVEQAGEIFKAVTPQLSVPEVTALAEWTAKLTEANISAYRQGYADGMKAQEPTIKALGEELRKARKGIADEKVLIGYNMAVAICNKHLGESEE